MYARLRIECVRDVVWNSCVTDVLDLFTWVGARIVLSITTIIYITYLYLIELLYHSRIIERNEIVLVHLIVECLLLLESECVRIDSTRHLSAS